MTLYRVEVEKRLEVTFFVEADSRDEAEEVAGGVAEGIDEFEWSDWHGWDFDSKEIVADPTIEQPFLTKYERGKLLMHPETILKDVKDLGVWVGGPRGGWESNLDYQNPKPPEPDPNQTQLFKEGGDLSDRNRA